MSPARGRLCTLLALLATVPATADEGKGVSSRGVAALPDVLPLVEASDPDVRLRARRLVRRIALDFYRSRTPEGMRLIPGRFEITAKEVRCPNAFFLAIHEVTLADFRAFAARHDLNADRWNEGDGALPVTAVSLQEARAFARSRGARIPTQAELERAGHGGGPLRYPWGDRFDPFRVNSREAGRGKPASVGGRRAGVSVHGIADLLGNVAEWTETSSGRAGGKRYVVVGGSYRESARPGVRPTYRLSETARLPDVGFRLALSLPTIPVVSGKGS